MREEEFKNLILMGKSKTRYEIVNFILHTLHNSVNSGGWYYYCPDIETGKCKMCVILIGFLNFEKNFEKNMFDASFLFNYYTKLCQELLQLFDQKKIVLDAFRESTSSGVGTGTLATAGMFLFLTASDTINRSRWYGSKEKNYQFLLNFKIRLLDIWLFLAKK